MSEARDTRPYRGPAFYITTAIDYTNAPPHIGHAYEKVLADVIARYRRLRGEEVFFLTGVDQHGQKVKQAAEKKGIEPQEFADRITSEFRALWKTLGVEPDGWAQTTDQVHRVVVQRILQTLHDRGELYKAKHEGFYSVRQEQFLTEKERGPDGEFGSEWGEVIHLEEENWYFRLSAHRDWLASFLEENRGFVCPEFRMNELLNAVERLSGDLCISRPKERLAWGIELPFDPDYVTYVWFDALINYISFAGYLQEEAGNLPEFARLWPCNAHVIGKDILVPAHGIYWPVMLHAMGFADEEMPTLLVHGWWNIGGAKMSKSAGNIVDPAVLAEKYGPDALRYYLMRDIATGRDSDFSEERLRTRYNADLANDLGNLLNRSLSMARRYRKGILQRGDPAEEKTRELRALLEKTIAGYLQAMDDCQIHTGLEVVWNLISFCNGYVESTAPWQLAKQEDAKGRLDRVLYSLAEVLRAVAVLISPVLPRCADNIFGQLQCNRPVSLETMLDTSQELTDGHQVGKPTPLFPRLEEKGGD